MEKVYRRQVSLLLSVLPEVTKEKCFALHGGTAINLFVRDMPRLSVDIDLTYLPIEDRNISLKHISEALTRIKSNIEKVVPGVRITPRVDAGKLQISANGVDVKVEVNLVNRGTLVEPKKMSLSEKAQKLQRFPSINWKLQNLQKLKDKNLEKHKEQYEILKEKLNK